MNTRHPLCFDTDSEQVRLPVWLQTLMDACCLASDFSLQGVAISLLMDLVGLTQSVAMVTAESVASAVSSEPAQPMSPSQGRVAVVIRPPLTQGILKYIADKTNFFRVQISLMVTVLWQLFGWFWPCLISTLFPQSVALILWDQLNEGTPQHHQRSVELFYQLHNLVPSSSICEDVISQQLMHRDKVGTVDTNTNKVTAHTTSLGLQTHTNCHWNQCWSIFLHSENSAGGPCEVLCAVASDKRFEHDQVFSFQSHIWQVGQPRRNGASMN